MTTTVFIPVSREWSLARLFASLEMLECDRETTNLTCYVDGDAALFLKARNLTEESKFNQRLCVQRPRATPVKEFDLEGRRKRIADIKNESKGLIEPCDYVLGTEDDCILPANALKKLLSAYSFRTFAGLISGVQVGRHGVNHLGAWRVDDVYEPKLIESARVEEGMQQVDATGFFGYITRYENYVEHEYAPFENILGPDISYGLWLRQQGLLNYIDYSIRIEHRKRNGEVITINNSKLVQVSFTKGDRRWVQRIDHLY